MELRTKLFIGLGLAVGATIAGIIWYKKTTAEDGGSENKSDNTSSTPAATTSSTSSSGSTNTTSPKSTKSNSTPAAPASKTNANFDAVITNTNGKPNKDNIITITFGNKNAAQFYTNDRIILAKENKTIAKGKYSNGGKTITLDSGKTFTNGSVFTNLLNAVK